MLGKPSPAARAGSKHDKILRHVRFGSLFAICFIAGIGIVLSPPVQLLDEAFSRTLVTVSQGLIRICGGIAFVEGAVLRAPSGFGVEMKDGCNAFPPSLVPNPGWFASIYSPETPEIGLAAALVGQPEP